LQFTATVHNITDEQVVWNVNGVVGGNASLGTISSDGLYTAPDCAVVVLVSAVSEAIPSESATSYVVVRAPHPVGVRTTSGLAEFFSRSSGVTFTPRGNNYIRMKDQIDNYEDLVHEHSTFTVGLYDANRAEAALEGMQNGGYNIVRVWLTGCCEDTIGDENGGLSQAYLANVIDYLRRAKSHGIYVILTTGWIPKYGGYREEYATCVKDFDYYNTLNLCAGGVRAVSHYFHDLVKDLLSQNAPMDAIFSYELRDYYFNNSDRLPLSRSGEIVTTANGQTYDMASPSSRQQMMDDGMVYFVKQVRDEIRKLDPTALVDLGFFVPEGPNPIRVGDLRIVRVYPAVVRSDADFVSISAYAIAGLTLAQYVQNYGFLGFQQKQPVVMAEFGAWKSEYPNILDAAEVLKSWQVSSCKYNIKGWLLWTWDSEAPEVLPDLWSAKSGDGSVNQSLSPFRRFDPCVDRGQ
jgi:hypothetical protein